MSSSSSDVDDIGRGSSDDDAEAILEIRALQAMADVEVDDDEEREVMEALRHRGAARGRRGRAGRRLHRALARVGDEDEEVEAVGGERGRRGIGSFGRLLGEFGAAVEGFEDGQGIGTVVAGDIPDDARVGVGYSRDVRANWAPQRMDDGGEGGFAQMVPAPAGEEVDEVGYEHVGLGERDLRGMRTGNPLAQAMLDEMLAGGEVIGGRGGYGVRRRGRGAGRGTGRERGRGRGRDRGRAVLGAVPEELVRGLQQPALALLEAGASRAVLRQALDNVTQAIESSAQILEGVALDLQNRTQGVARVEGGLASVAVPSPATAAGASRDVAAGSPDQANSRAGAGGGVEADIPECGDRDGFPGLFVDKVVRSLEAVEGCYEGVEGTEKMFVEMRNVAEAAKKAAKKKKAAAKAAAKAKADAASAEAEAKKEAAEKELAEAQENSSAKESEKTEDGEPGASNEVAHAASGASAAADAGASSSAALTSPPSALVAGGSSSVVAAGMSSSPAGGAGSISVADVAAAVAGAVASSLPEGESASCEVGSVAVPSGFPRIVAERAASAGISLVAPANEDPDVVALAVARTGIDPTFLSALPDDMRAEVLSSYFEQVSTGRDEGGGDSSTTTMLHQEFLVALPPALRADVLVQEASYRAAQTEAAGSAAAAPTLATAEAAGGSNGAGVGSAAAADAGADVSTFLSGLPAELRQEILLTSEDSLVARLTPDLAAEAQALRDEVASAANRDRGAAHRGEASAGARRSSIAAALDRASALLTGLRIPGGYDEMDARRTVRRAGRGRYGGPGGEAERAIEGARSMALSFSWKYDEATKGYYRLQPDQNLEPGRVFGKKSVTALVQLLELHLSHQWKPILYSVLSVLCKRTDSRRELLGTLFGLLFNDGRIDGGSTDSSSADPDATAVSKFTYSAARVRRILDVLVNICRMERLAGEDIVAVPFQNKMRAYPALTRGERGEAISPVVALVGFLGQSSVKRSSLHQDQILSVLAHAFAVLPSGVLPVPKEKSSPRAARVLRSPSAAVAGPVRSTAAPAEGDQPESNATGNSADASRAKPVTKAREVPVCYRVPELRDVDVAALTDVILQDGASEKTYKRALGVLGKFGLLLVNRDRSLQALCGSAAVLGKSVGTAFERSIKRSGVSSGPGSLDMSMSSSSSELSFLRVTKAMAVLLKESSLIASDVTKLKADAEEVNVVDVDWFVCLKDVWVALDRILVVYSNSKPSAKAMVSLLGKRPRSLFDGSVGTNDFSGPNAAQQGNSEDGSIRNIVAVERNGRSQGEKCLSPTLARLSPVIESFFVCHGIEISDNDVEEPGDPEVCVSFTNEYVKPGSSTGSRNEAAVILGAFVKRHREAINSIIRVDPSLLSTSFRPALLHAHAIDFDNKKLFFRSVLRKRTVSSYVGSVRMTVRRDRVFEDSYHQLRSLSPEQLRGRLNIQFSNEEGIDAGGLTREWYVILARQMFDPNYALFCRSAAKAATYQPNKSSFVNQDHLDYFRFVGLVFGKAIYDGQLLDAYFTRAFYKHILGIKPTYHDIEAEDPSYYTSLCWMLNNDITGVIDVTFCSEYEEFGQKRTVDLKPGGRNISVTEENKEEYVKLVTEVKLTKAIKQQIAAFKEGFYRLIPLKDVRIFNEVELELLTSGLPDIDVQDLKANVSYSGYTPGSPQVRWFWTAVGKMGQEDLARLVMFVTGTSKVPLEGFGSLQGMSGCQKFQIHRAALVGNTRLPTAHTCFNQLDLPEYDDAARLSERLLVAIRECNVGFAFG